MKSILVVLVSVLMFVFSSCDTDCKSDACCRDTLVYYQTIIETQSDYISGLEEFCIQTEKRCSQYEFHNRKLDSAFQIMVFRYDTLYRSKYCSPLIDGPNYVIQKGDCEKMDSLLTDLCSKQE